MSAYAGRHELAVRWQYALMGMASALMHPSERIAAEARLNQYFDALEQVAAETDIHVTYR